MLCMLAQGVLSFTVTLMIQYKVFYRIQRVVSRGLLGPENVKSPLDPEDEDEDVKNERDRIITPIVLNNSLSENVLIIIYHSCSCV